MARCRVSYQNDQGLHSIEVNAETLFEAVTEAISEFREDKTIAELPDANTDITVVVPEEPRKSRDDPCVRFCGLTDSLL